METGSPVVRKFFEEYERSRNTFDQSLIDCQYPDVFMFAGPNGARVAEKPAVLAGICKGQELFRSLGHRRTTLVSLSETRLDERYTMVRARFVWRFEKAAAPVDVNVDSTFILHIKDDVARIVFQHEREDFLDALRARGLLPARA